MTADEQHTRVVVEHRLRAVAVVGVVVEDHDPLALIGQRSGNDRDVGDHAETHRLDGGGVMAGRAYGTERGVALAGAQRFDRSQTGAGGQARRFETRWACVRVGIEPAAARRRRSPRSARGTTPGELARGRPARRAAVRAAEMASPRSARRTPSSTASSRSGRSGWRGPARCSRYTG